jgi:hypothetical protein
MLPIFVLPTEQIGCGAEPVLSLVPNLDAMRLERPAGRGQLLASAMICVNRSS